jgi:MoaA/NifB/PqqE/SkfB family radical SAM enzyme
LHLNISEWKRIVESLINFGILEIYVTGGENLIVREYFELTEFILAAGCTTGLSTNAMSVTDRVLHFLREHRLTCVQVSLDGATPETNDRIRGVTGAFHKSLRGIKRLATVSQLVMNTVVNRHNIGEIEALIVLGKSLSISNFRFSPQKQVGRAKDLHQVKLTTQEWLDIPFAELADKYSVRIDHPSPSEKCGSGFSGFAINELGHAYPCIFATHEPKFDLGCVLELPLEKIWFESPRLDLFRTLPAELPCTRCECI